MIFNFYEQSEIFITGGSGVVGKAAIEKLLRSCDVKFIYVLLRSKKGKSAEARLEELKNSKIFRVLKELRPNELDKLVVIPGDTTQDGLGISPENRILLKNVSVFFHSAATTRFDEPLRTAIACNLKSTLEALKLSETLTNLKIFLHVSTLFCNPHVKHLEAEIYPSVFDWKIAMKLLDSSNDEIDSTLSSITDKVITGFPNTYVFTKHLSEQLVNDYRSKLPVAIFRPSIVTAALEEPEPGFTETMTGVMGMFVVWGTGLFQVLLCRKKTVLDYTPLDINNKLMLMFAAKSAQLKKENFEEKIPVCLGSSKGILSYTLGELGTMISRSVKEYPYGNSLWIPHVTLTGCSFIFWVYNLFLQLLPSSIFDILMMIFRQKPIFMKIQRKIFVNNNALRYFLCTEFYCDGVTDFQEYLKISKGTIFDIALLEKCCATDENMESVVLKNVTGSRKFLLNEDESTLPRCRTLLKAKMFAYNILRMWVLYAVGSNIYSRVINYMEL